MNQEIENQIRIAYRRNASAYRENDEKDAIGREYRRVRKILGRLSRSFRRPITALDAGCGTGRYFHCLKNTRQLVGLDVSPEMLQQARHPVKEEEVSINEIHLVCGNVHTESFPAESFDLIYSIGVFGNGCEISRELLSKFYYWLTPGGRVFFDVFDAAELSFHLRIWQKLENYLRYRVGLNILRRALNESLPFYHYSSAQIVHLLESSGFFTVAVYPQESQTPLGPGKKLHCHGGKTEDGGRKTEDGRPRTEDRGRKREGHSKWRI